MGSTDGSTHSEQTLLLTVSEEDDVNLEDDVEEDNLNMAQEDCYSKDADIEKTIEELKDIYCLPDSNLTTDVSATNSDESPMTIEGAVTDSVSFGSIVTNANTSSSITGGSQASHYTLNNGIQHTANTQSVYSTISGVTTPVIFNSHLIRNKESVISHPIHSYQIHFKNTSIIPFGPLMPRLKQSGNVSNSNINQNTARNNNTNSGKMPPNITVTKSPVNSAQSPFTAGSPLNTTSGFKGVYPLTPQKKVARQIKLTSEPHVSRSNRSVYSPKRMKSTHINITKLGETSTFIAKPIQPTLRNHSNNLRVSKQQREELDSTLKQLVRKEPSELVEWLIQNHLIPTSQTCNTHRSDNGLPVTLKLGLLSNGSMLPASGGYTWICKQCSTSVLISVFRGSIFEDSPYYPAIILKLIYYWACQIPPKNIILWANVELSYVTTFFMYMRAICTAGIQKNLEIMGGLNKIVQVGIVGLNTLHSEGAGFSRIEVLGVMDREKELVRLLVLDPAHKHRNSTKRHMALLSPLCEWVHRQSTIATDVSVDKFALFNIGFTSIIQTTPFATESVDPKYSNILLRNYLIEKVPVLFQTTLPLLPTNIIQQFLDELVWRERWGGTATEAFNNITAHIAEQTSLAGSSLVVRLQKIADNPFKDWHYDINEEIQILAEKHPPSPTIGTTSLASPESNSRFDSKTSEKHQQRVAKRLFTSNNC